MDNVILFFSLRKINFSGVGMTCANAVIVPRLFYAVSVPRLFYAVIVPSLGYAVIVPSCASLKPSAYNLRG